MTYKSKLVRRPQLPEEARHSARVRWPRGCPAGKGFGGSILGDLVIEGGCLGYACCSFYSKKEAPNHGVIFFCFLMEYRLGRFLLKMLLKM